MRVVAVYVHLSPFPFCITAVESVTRIVNMLLTAQEIEERRVCCVSPHVYPFLCSSFPPADRSLFPSGIISFYTHKKTLTFLALWISWLTSLQFCLSEHVFISPSVWKYIFTG